MEPQAISASTAASANKTSTAVGERFFARGSFGIGLSVGHPALNARDNLFFGKLCIFEAADFRAGECWQSLHVALQKHFNGGIGKPDQTKHDSVAAKRIELVGIGYGKDLFVAETRAIEVLCSRGARKGVLMYMCSGNQRHTHIVADAGIFERNQLSNFGIADVQFLQIFQAAGPHASFVQSPVVSQRMRVAARQKHRQQKEQCEG
jgi:hypothetical protein